MMIQGKNYEKKIVTLLHKKKSYVESKIYITHRNNYELICKQNIHVYEIKFHLQKEIKELNFKSLCSVFYTVLTLLMVTS